MKKRYRILALILLTLTLFGSLLPVSAASSTADIDPVLALDNYLEVFFYVDDHGYGRLNNMPSNGFWTDAEVLELFIDAYERVGDKKYLEVAEQFYKGIIQRRGKSWSWNEYNDDVFWMCLATARLAKHTGDKEQINLAKLNWNMCFNRAWDTEYYGGGLWWKQNAEVMSKNGCVNGPGAMSALAIYELTGEKTYLDHAIEIVDWMCGKLLTPTGRFLDNIDINGKINEWTNTGNQGNVIGPCTTLYKLTGDGKYRQWATAAANHALTLDLWNEGGNSGDTIGGKGLLARQLGYFYRECEGINSNTKRNIRVKMLQVAKDAWNNQNSRGIIWGTLKNKTVEDLLTNNTPLDSGNPNTTLSSHASWGCSAAVSWFLQTPGLLPIDNKPADTTAAPSTTAKPEEDLTPEEPQEPGFPVAGFFTPIVVAVVLSVSGVLLVGGGTVAVILILRKKKK